MEEIKLVAFDLDGTLLDDNSEVSEENLRAIEDLTKRGIHVVICTGRALEEIPSSLRNNENLRYVIFSNGSVILDKTTGEKITNCLSHDISSKIFNVTKDYEVIIAVHYNENNYVSFDFMNEDKIAYYNVSSGSKNAIQNYAIKLENFDEWKNKVDGAEVLNIFFHDKDECVECEKRLREIPNLLVVVPDGYNIDMINDNAGKGKALSYLANRLGIDKSNVIAVGDSGNDLPMMEVVGTSFAVSNANNVLKEKCDKIICSNNEHVVDYILKNYVIKD